ncbi:hypothetical protein ACHAXS_001124, partial [Conticribra weissflogii]
PLPLLDVICPVVFAVISLPRWEGRSLTRGLAPANRLTPPGVPLEVAVDAAVSMLLLLVAYSRGIAGSGSGLLLLRLPLLLMWTLFGLF